MLFIYNDRIVRKQTFHHKRRRNWNRRRKLIIDGISEINIITRWHNNNNNILRENNIKFRQW